MLREWNEAELSKTTTLMRIPVGRDFQRTRFSERTRARGTTKTSSERSAPTSQRCRRRHTTKLTIRKQQTTTDRRCLRVWIRRNSCVANRIVTLAVLSVLEKKKKSVLRRRLWVAVCGSSFSDGDPASGFQFCVRFKQPHRNAPRIQRKNALDAIQSPPCTRNLSPHKKRARSQPNRGETLPHSRETIRRCRYRRRTDTEITDCRPDWTWVPCRTPSSTTQWKRVGEATACIRRSRTA